MDKNKEKEEQSIMDKSMRSVFVGNIPYEATEEKLKDIFSEVGPVLSFKLVFDRESGKPKGYGFCEYKDQETALSAMRNLNGFEIGGRSLRVDNACTEKSRMEMQALMQGPLVENPYGEAVAPEKAPHVISKAVASLPPEQMFELMKQMKTCIQNNPNEARNMLLQNPQLAYALLQAQVVMRIIDPATAVTMLHPMNQVPPVLTSLEKVSVNIQPPIAVSNNTAPIGNIAPITQAPPAVLPVVTQPFPGSGIQDVDLRSLDSIRMNAGDPRLMSQRATVPALDQDMRSLQPPPPSQNDNFSRDPRTTMSMPYPSDPRQRPADPRQAAKIPGPVPPVSQPAHRPPITGIPTGASDQEKAALIMQVLQLSDEQIAMLPPEQRTSILVLKEQIAKSTQR
ncbi:cleavage stimulation factor subunit 2 CstF64 [Arctopsyche grandis]|uniref:cleavage stimulation factor subunit 2 CstF64 n=1 Tax=Arctopsyche grandis TaxID=121162 RepID=UPI00406D8CED